MTKVDNKRVEDKQEYITELRTRIIGTLNRLEKFMRVSGNKQLVGKFRDMMQPPIDNGLIPFDSKRGVRAYNENKVQCVFALISMMMQEWWELQRIPKQQRWTERAVKINSLLDELDMIVASGLDNFIIAGTQAEGYFLFLK